MHFDTQHSKLILSTGKEFYCYGSGLSYYPGTDADDPEYLTYGSDGGIPLDKCTAEELYEIADHMMHVWRNLRDKYHVNRANLKRELATQHHYSFTMRWNPQLKKYQTISGDTRMEQTTVSELLDQAIHIIEHDNPQNAVQVLYEVKALCEHGMGQSETEMPLPTDDDEGTPETEHIGEMQADATAVAREMQNAPAAKKPA